MFVYIAAKVTTAMSLVNGWIRLLKFHQLFEQHTMTNGQLDQIRSESTKYLKTQEISIPEKF